MGPILSDNDNHGGINVSIIVVPCGLGISNDFVDSIGLLSLV